MAGQAHALECEPATQVQAAGIEFLFRMPYADTTEFKRFISAACARARALVWRSRAATCHIQFHGARARAGEVMHGCGTFCGQAACVRRGSTMTLEGWHCGIRIDGCGRGRACDDGLESMNGRHRKRMGYGGMVDGVAVAAQCCSCFASARSCGSIVTGELRVPQSLLL